MAKRTLTIDIVGDERDAIRAFDKTESAAGKTGNGIVAKLKGSLGGLSGFGSALAGGLLGGGTVAAFTGLQGAVTGVVDEYQESVRVGKETERVIRTTGGAAHVTADEVGNLAERLSEKAGIDDELIQTGANVLLTFTNIRNEIGKGNNIYDRAVGLATDLSVATGKSLPTASRLLGKALNDPIKGITSLSRLGVTFTGQQQDQIKLAMLFGDTLGAQRIILDEVGKKYSGAAAAGATWLDKMKVKLANFQEDAGRWTAETAIPWLREMWPKVQQEWTQGVAKAKEIIEPFLVIVEGLWERFGDKIVGFVMSAWGSIRDIVEGVFNVVKGFLEVGMAIINGDWDKAWQGIKDIVSGVWQVIVGIIDGAWNTISTIISTALQIIGIVLGGAWDTFKSLIAGAWLGIVGVVSSGIDAVVGFVAGLPDRLLAFVWSLLAAGASLGGAIIDGIKGGIESAAGAIGDVASAILNAFKQGWNSVADRINDFIPNSVGFDTPFGFVGVDLPDNPIPTFHTGGIVPGRPGQEVLIRALAGERVTPANRANLGNSGDDDTIVLPIQVDGRTLTEIVIKNLNTPGGPQIAQRAIATR